MHTSGSPKEVLLGQVLALSGEAVVLGRHPTCQIVLDNASVSRQHAQIIEEHGIFLVEDLRSRNGTQVNRQSIRGRTELRDGDEIKVCDYAFTFMRKATGPAIPITPGSSVIAIGGIRETVSSHDAEIDSEPELIASENRWKALRFSRRSRQALPHKDFG